MLGALSSGAKTIGALEPRHHAGPATQPLGHRPLAALVRVSDV